MSSVRTFLAIPIPAHIQSAIEDLQKGLKKQLPDVRWVKADNLHLTLHFFGEVSQETLERIKVSVLSVKGCQQPFRVDIKGFGAFPNLRRPRVLWLGLRQLGPLRQIHRAIQEALELSGIPTDTRGYSPHLTIGRVRNTSADLTKQGVTLSDTELGHFDVDRIVLYESRLQPAGAQHIPLLTVTLDEPGEP